MGNESIFSLQKLLHLKKKTQENTQTVLSKDTFDS